MKVGTDAMLLGSFIETRGKVKCLDVGSGTGVLSLMVAQKNFEIEVNAVEIDNLAAKECALNFRNSNWVDRLWTIHSNIFDFSPVKRYDLIISNPPFYTSTLENKDERKATARHAQHMELSKLISKMQRFLSPIGHLWVIIPKDSFFHWYMEFEKIGVRVQKKIYIRPKPSKEVNRMIVCFGRKTILNAEESTFVIRNEDNSYSSEYIELTKEFHSKVL